MENKKEILQNLIIAERYFTADKYRTLTSLASKLFEDNNFSGCKEVLDRLPTKDTLLANLMAKLKGKSVYDTIKRIGENKAKNDLTTLKGLSSLITHVVIECEHGNTEYEILLPMLSEKVADLIYKL